MMKLSINCVDCGDFLLRHLDYDALVGRFDDKSGRPAGVMG
ncbi:hypothetical protein ACVWZ6_002737 [Bradyrhizobium sp. GM6.1]